MTLASLHALAAWHTHVSLEAYRGVFALDAMRDRDLIVEKKSEAEFHATAARDLTELASAFEILKRL